VDRFDLHTYLYSASGLDCSVYSAELAKFKCKSGGNHLSSLAWTPDGSHIVACDSHLSYRLSVYTPAGHMVAAYEAYQNALGIKQVIA